jgi:hypothetical protein
MGQRLYRKRLTDNYPQAVALADSRHDIFPRMFESIAGCIFFGSPFSGAPVAACASMLAQLGQRFDQTTSSKLLDLMKPGEESLEVLKNDFMRLVGKLNQKIELYCFWEEQPTDFAKMANLPPIFSYLKILVPKELKEFVSKESATLTGVDSMGLASNHRNLVKFDGFKDEKYQLVRDPLKRIIHGAHLVVKGRFNSVRGVDRSVVNGILDALDGAQVPKKRKALSQKFMPSSWIAQEKEYIEWLSKEDKCDETHHIKHTDCLWIRGPEGRGKTSTTMATLAEIDEIIRHDEESNIGQAPVLLAYFFCDSATDYSTAEDLLKSLIRQLILQQEILAPHAKNFATPKGKSTTTSSTPLTVENLWRTLEDMLNDEFIGRRVYFVLNNLHVLPEDSESTAKLFAFIRAELTRGRSDQRAVTRWFVTSQESHHIEKTFKSDGVRLVDLEDERYGNQVQLELKKHAQKMVTQLGEVKKYNKALAYYVSSLIGRRAQSTQWIDIICIQLDELTESEGDLRVRRVLEGMQQDLKALLVDSWMKVFNSAGDDVEKVKELLRALVLTYEDPTETELGVLAGLSPVNEDKTEFRALIQKCSPLLAVKRTTKGESKVSFLSMVVKNHLLENSGELLGMREEETKWQQGVVALRCFSHIMERLDYPEPGPTPEIANATETHEDAEEGGVGESDGADDNVEGGDVDGQDGEGEDNEGGDGDAEDDGEDDSESDDVDDNDSETGWDDDDSATSEENDEDTEEEVPVVLEYPVKYWLRHASKATVDIAEELSREEGFWGPESLVRKRWLEAFDELTDTFDYLDIHSMNSMHIAASVGFRTLVAALLKNGHMHERDVRDKLTNAPVFAYPPQPPPFSFNPTSQVWA